MIDYKKLLKEDNLVYVDKENWKDIYKLLADFNVTPKMISSFLKCDRKYVERITEQIPHLFLNNKIKYILKSNAELDELLYIENIKNFDNNYYFFNKNEFVRWLSNNCVISCKTFKIDLNIFLLNNLPEEILADIYKAYNFLYFKEYENHYFLKKHQNENIDKMKNDAIKTINSFLNPKGKKLFEIFISTPGRTLKPTEEHKFSINLNEIFEKYSLYTVENLAGEYSREIGYRNALKEGLFKIKIGDKNSKTLFLNPHSFNPHFKMPCTFTITDLKSVLTKQQFDELFILNKEDQ